MSPLAAIAHLDADLPHPIGPSPDVGYDLNNVSDGVIDDLKPARVVAARVVAAWVVGGPGAGRVGVVNGVGDGLVGGQFEILGELGGPGEGDEPGTETMTHGRNADRDRGQHEAQARHIAVPAELRFCARHGEVVPRPGAAR